jgi:chaperone required for assembly of F1-ATPase
MRDFFLDALEHQDDGYGRAQKHMQRPLPKRFYNRAEVVPVEGAYALRLDGRTVRTPGRVEVAVPAKALADRLAAEWDAQREHIDPTTMPLTRLVNSALEGGKKVKPVLRAEVMRYAANDLLLYRADSPQSLVEEQEASWDTVLVALARHFGVTFQPTIGVMYHSQPAATLAKLNEGLEGVSLIGLTALTSIAGLTGSGLLALALRHKLIAPETAWLAAHVDEDFNISLWGEDGEALARRAARKTEFDAALTVLELAGEA